MLRGCLRPNRTWGEEDRLATDNSERKGPLTKSRERDLKNVVPIQNTALDQSKRCSPYKHRAKPRYFSRSSE